MRRYLIILANDDISQYGRQFSREFIIKGYKNAKTFVNEVYKYQEYTGEYVSMKRVVKNNERQV